MAIFRCKMCGGDLEVVEGLSSCNCEYCGTRQTIPTVKDEGLQILFNRANVLRMKSEYDQASEIYESIIQKDDTEADAYWGLILCRYGIEYVEDPRTSRRIPTCHRVSYDAVISDEDYQKAIQYADPVQRGIYEEQALEIDKIQKGILDRAQKEDAYDVFICYKEEDESGSRTKDSLLANDIYDQLTQEGFKVFYAAITLKDKLGTEYEPYIFSALNTAKVMLVVGTNPEYFEAAWVRNEWTRFLKIMRRERNKLLIPCYREIDPYELPEEFAHLQAQDMSRIGFIRDIISDIKKIAEKDSDKSETVVSGPQKSRNYNVDIQLKRGNMALEEQEWERADKCFEKALDLDPENAEAYLGKLFAKENCTGLDAWVSMQSEKYAYDVSTDHVEVVEEDITYIAQSMLKYTNKGYLDRNEIRKFYEYEDRWFDSALSCRMNQKSVQLSELASERLLNRAKKFANVETRKQIDDGLEAITASLDQRIEREKKHDEDTATRMKRAYAEHLREADRKVEEKYRELIPARGKFSVRQKIIILMMVGAFVLLFIRSGSY